MNLFLLITVVLIGSGGIVMLISIIKYNYTMKNASNIVSTEKSSKKILYKVNKLLMIFFLLGYLLVLFCLIFKIHIISGIFIGLIFFFGAIFVFIGIVLQADMLTSIGEKHKILQQNNLDLISEIKLKEVAIKEAEDANAANIAKSQFLANMSHELRTPINGMLGSVELLQDSNVTVEQKDLLDIAYNCGNSLLELITDILDISKIESGKFEIDKHDFNLYSEIEKIVIPHAINAMKKDVEFIFRLPPNIPVMLNSDSGRLRQILNNLCSNSVKFTDKGQIYLIIEKVSETKENIVLKFKVKDSGIGISKDNLKKLFSSFTQADSSTTRKYGGTGLGLYISKRITQLMGGEIGIISELNKGSEFWFELPFLKQADKTFQTTNCDSEMKNSIDTKNYRILIVDDIETNRIILQENLKKWGFKYESVENGTKALNLLKKRKAENNYFQVALLDYMMPGMNGVELAKKIAKNELLNNIKLILLSSADNIEKMNELKKIGFDASFAKPIRSSTLYNVLISTLTEGKYNNIATSEVDKELLSSKSDAKQISILIAEDDPVNQSIISKMLNNNNNNNYLLELVSNGKEAVSKFKFQRFDIVLMDCQMPILDGFEATRQIREWESEKLNCIETPDNLNKNQRSIKENSQVLSKKRTPIIALTANVFTSDKEKCIEAGMDDFISKPVSIKKINDVVKQWSNINPVL